MAYDRKALRKMVSLTEKARKLLIDARVAGALAEGRDMHGLSLLVGAAETHVSVLHAHLWGELVTGEQQE